MTMPSELVNWCSVRAPVCKYFLLRVNVASMHLACISGSSSPEHQSSTLFEYPGNFMASCALVVDCYTQSSTSSLSFKGDASTKGVHVCYK